MSYSGRCQCGAIRYTVEGEPKYHALCHCDDCRRSAGAPVVSWMAYNAGKVTIEGTPVTYASSEHGRRQFCGTCGTGLFYVNEVVLPGLIDIQSATLDDPNALSPTLHVQLAEQLHWMPTINDLPGFARFPG